MGNIKIHLIFVKLTLKNTDLNYMGPLIWRFFSIVNTGCYTLLVSWMQTQNCRQRGTLYRKVIYGFSTCRKSALQPSPCSRVKRISILYSTTLLNQLILVLLVNSLWFFLYKIMSSANRDNFTPFFLMWMTFIIF